MTSTVRSRRSGAASTRLDRPARVQPAKGDLDRRLGVERGRVEERDGTVPRLNEKHDLRAAQDDGLGTVRDQAGMMVR